MTAAVAAASRLRRSSRQSAASTYSPIFFSDFGALWQEFYNEEAIAEENLSAEQVAEKVSARGPDR